MQRKPFWKLLITGIGYMILGNIMSTVMTVAASVVADIPMITAVLFLFTLFIFYSLCFTAAFKDGQRERLLEKNHRVDGIIKGRWTLIGFIMFAVMCIPSVILLIDSIKGFIGGYLIPYRMVCGMIYPLALTMGVNYPDPAGIPFLDPFGMLHPERAWFDSPDIVGMPPYFALIFMACYVFIPLATAIGFNMGYSDKLNPDKVFYEKR